jgi:hypothetical protein
VFLAQEVSLFQQAHHFGEKLVRDLVFQKPLLVFTEAARIERLLLQFQVQKPLEQQVVAQPFAEGPVGGHAEERRQQPRPQQALWREGGPTDLAVHRLDAVGQTPENLVAQTLDGSDRMPFRNPGVPIDHRQKLPLRSLPASHDPFYPITNFNTRLFFCFSAC